MPILGSTITFWVIDSIAVWYRYNGGKEIFCRVLNKLDRLEDIEKLRIERAANARNLLLRGEFWSIFPLALIYAFARISLLVEAFVGLRDLEASAFVNVGWSTYLSSCITGMSPFMQIQALLMDTDEWEE